MDINRRTAYFTLMDVEGNKAYSNISLNNYISRGKPDSPAFVRELVYGVLKNRTYLDYTIQQFIKTPVEKMKSSDLTVLRMGVYQLKFMNSVPEYAAVNESVTLAKRFCRGREGFINGVLRSYIREDKEVKLPKRGLDEVKHLAVKYSYEPWIIELWMSQYAPAFVEELLAAGNLTPDFVIRVNTLKTTREDLKRRITSKEFEATDGLFSKDALRVVGSGLLGGKLYKNGMFSVQDESSMLAVNMLDPQPGEVIIDTCAAPGGKTMAIAEKMGNIGQVISWDIYRRKLSLITKEAERLGVDIVTTKAWDATRVDSTMIEKADRVLVDAPCSGLGVVRRKPEIKYKKCTSDMQDLPKKQLAILSAASKYVKPGGTLVYCTCTISHLENQKVIVEFLKRNPSFEKEEMIQLLPNINNTDGFFICKMKKADSLINE